MDLNKIKEAMNEVRRMSGFYQAFADVDALLATVGNLESTRLSLEPKVAALQKEVASLDDKGKALKAAKDKALADVAEKKAAGLAKVADDLALAKDAAAEESGRLSEELRNDIDRLENRRHAVLSDIEKIEEEQKKAMAVLDDLHGQAATEQTKLGVIRKQIADLKASL